MAIPGRDIASPSGGSTTKSPLAHWLFLGTVRGFVAKLDLIETFFTPFYLLILACHAELSLSWCPLLSSPYFPERPFTKPYKLYYLLFPSRPSFPASLLWVMPVPLPGLPCSGLHPQSQLAQPLVPCSNTTFLQKPPVSSGPPWVTSHVNYSCPGLSEQPLSISYVYSTIHDCNYLFKWLSPT